MSKVAILCAVDALVPWFDNPAYFNELGVFNLGVDGVWIVADYSGDVPWVNQMDPDTIINTCCPPPLMVVHPSYVMAGVPFDISGTYHTDGAVILFWGEIPISVVVEGGRFSRTITINALGIYRLSNATSMDTNAPVAVTPATINVMM